MGKFELQTDGHTVELLDQAAADLALAAHESGRRGPIMIPRDPQACATALRRGREYAEQMQAEFAHLAAERTANEKLAARVETILEQRLGQFGNDEPSAE